LSKEQTAFHEAGHAVMHVALFVPFRYVTIQPRNQGLNGGPIMGIPSQYFAATRASARNLEN
jgi:ATP-dependent Zn protease